MTDRINIQCAQTETLITLPQHIRKMAYACPQFITFNLNFKNIFSGFGNTLLSINPLNPPVQIPEGCYSLITLNKFLESFDAPNFFPKIVPNISGTNFDVCVYASASNRTADIGRTVLISEGALSSLPLLNTEIFYGTIFFDYMYIECDLFHTHQNPPNNSRVMLTKREFIPISIEPMQHMTFLFQDTIKYDFTGDTTITVKFLD